MKFLFVVFYLSFLIHPAEAVTTKMFKVLDTCARYRLGEIDADDAIEKLKLMNSSPGKPKDIVFDNTGQYLATGGSAQVTVWNFKGNGPEGTVPGQLVLHNDPINCLCFANRSSLLISGAKDGYIAMWKLDKNGDGEPIDKVFINSTPTSLRWRNDDKAILASSNLGQVFCWNTNPNKGVGVGFKN